MPSRCQLACLVICAFASSVAYSQDSRVKAITGVTLIDGTGGAPLQDTVIVVDGARVSQVGARSAVTVPQGATIIDGKGATCPGSIARSRAGWRTSQLIPRGR
jgi:hypothetical protein